MILRNLRRLVTGTLVFLIFGFSVMAQEEAESSSGSSFGIRDAGLSIGWYGPSMDYWNDTYMAQENWENRFRGNFIYSVFFQLDLISDIRFRVSASYWTERVTSGPIRVGEVPGTAQLTTSLVSFTPDIIYAPVFLTFAKFSPYIGVGGSFVLVQNKFIRTPEGSDQESYTLNGQDYTGSVLGGIERRIGKHFGIAAEFRYIFGGYTQEMKDASGNVTSHPVSLSGPQAGINLSYVFK